MGTVPTPYSQPSGAVVPVVGGLNTYRDTLNFLLASPRVHAYQGTAVTTLATSGTIYPIGLDSEGFDVVMSGDTPGHDNVTNNSRLVARTAGKYRIVGQITYATNATGVRGISFRVNAGGNPAAGTGIYGTNAGALSGSNTSVASAPIIYPLAAGDYVEMFGQQTSGGSLATVTGYGLTYAAMEWVGL